MDFTKKELYLIERTMDNLAGDHNRGVAQYLNVVNGLDPKIMEKLRVDDRIEEWVEAYDLMRTISAKCEEMRLSDKKQ